MSGTSELHSSPVEKEDNILDKLSSKDRFQYYYSNFLTAEERLVRERIIHIVSRGEDTKRWLRRQRNGA